MVVVRMGNASDSNNSVPVVFLNQLWERINELECTNVMLEPDAPSAWYQLEQGRGTVSFNLSSGGGWSVRAIDAMGRVVAHANDPFIWDLGVRNGEVLVLEAVRGNEVHRDRVVITP